MSQIKKIKQGWKSLMGLDAWEAEFDTLLAEAAVAASDDSPAPRLEVASYLIGFIQESAPQSEEMDKLDALARRLAADILQREIDDRLASIAARTAEYHTLRKSFTAAAEGAEAAAESIRLDRITGLIESATDTIASARELAGSLNEGKASERKVAELIDETTKAVEKLRSAAARLV